MNGPSSAKPDHSFSSYKFSKGRQVKEQDRASTLARGRSCCVNSASLDTKESTKKARLLNASVFHHTS